MTRPRSSFGRRAGARRLTQWVGPPEQGFIAVATTGATLISNLPVEEPFTIVRNRGAVAISIVTAADLDVVGAFGIGIVSAEAFAAGIGSVPTPYSDGDWGGWMVWRSFALRWDFSDATGARFAQIEIEVDSKAMRKVSPNEVIVLVAESQTGAFSMADGLRQLIKLS